MKTIDLHVHSCCSDGSLTPTELVALALSTGLSVFALTDHDTTDGFDEAVYVLNRGSEEAFVCPLAEQYGLLVTGGPDFHGKNKPDIALGTGIKSGLSIPYSLLEKLKAATAVSNFRES